MDGTYPIDTNELDDEAAEALAEEVGNLRLLRAAELTRRANPKKFHMDYFVHPCGTPACVLGNYAADPDTPFVIHRGDPWHIYTCVEPGPVGFDNHEICEHFAISREDAWVLFTSIGCGNAQTPDEAADFLEEFVAERRARRAKR